MVARRTPETGEIVAGRFRVDRVLGRGGMGAVFAATNQRTGGRVALKWMLPEAREADPSAATRFLREAEAAARINHPNVVKVYDVGDDAGSPFQVMELLSGRALSERFEEGPMEPLALARIMLLVTRGVAAAHREGIVHRDLKPENIFLCEDPDGGEPVPRVLDFGISRVLSGLPHSGKLTQTGAVLGTPFYMSPEQMGGEEVDARCDIYALGVILYEGLVGHVPYSGDSWPSLVLAVCHGNAVPPSELRRDVPVPLERIVLKAMAKEPERRYADAAALIAALESYLADPSALPVETQGAADGGLVDSTRPLPRASAGRRMFGFVALGALALAAMALWQFLGQQAEPVEAGAESSPAALPAHATEDVTAGTSDAPSPRPPETEEPTEPTPTPPPAGELESDEF